MKSFDKPKPTLNFDFFAIQINSYLSKIEGKAYTNSFVILEMSWNSISTTCKAR